ncbi:hypothetical protein GE09DRAFT_1269544 [Coniochaeta sp. 2T2.1]|nr:hypothetical protein GE09DRAFT_1269544 [Coniochaeta sp. 2T2.1]
MDAWFGVCLLPLLSSFPRLFDSLSFNCLIMRDDVLLRFESRITSSLRACTNLRSLSFRDLGASGLVDGSDIVGVLLANPQLEELTLEYGFRKNVVQDPHNPRYRWNAVKYMHSICDLGTDFTDWLERCVAPPEGYDNRVALSCRFGFDSCQYYRHGFEAISAVPSFAHYVKGDWQPTELEVWLDENAFETLQWVAENAASVESLTLIPDSWTTEKDCEISGYGIHLGKLPRLQVLYFQPLKGSCKYLYENWNHHFLASILDNCSSLRYVKIGVFAWRIFRESKANGEVAHLEHLEPAEQQDVEHFQLIPGTLLKVQYHPLRHPLWAPKPVDVIRESDPQFPSGLVPYAEYKSLTEIGTREISAWCEQQAQSLFPDSKRHDKLAGQWWMDSKLQREVAREIANSRRAGGQWKLRFSTIEELEELVPGLAEWEFRNANRGGDEALVEFCLAAVARFYKRWVDANQHRWHAGLKV